MSTTPTRTASRKSLRVRNKKNELLILIRSKRACCICHVVSGPVHIHHIDGNPNHSALANLAVLCLPHHDEATAGLNPGQVGIGRKLTPDEVRLHKEAWERSVSNETAWRRERVFHDRRKHSLTLFDFELMRTKNEILASRTEEAIENRFHYLTYLSQEFFHSRSPYRMLLLNAYADIAGREMEVKPISLCIVSAIDDDYTNLDAINHPDLKPSRTDKRALILGTQILSQVGYWAVAFGRDSEVVTKVCTSLSNIAALASPLEFNQLKTEVRSALNRMQSEIERLVVKEEDAFQLSEEYAACVAETLDDIKKFDS